MRLAWLRHAGTATWDTVRGPAASVSLMVDELGWHWPEPGTFVSNKGHVMGLTFTAPRDVEMQSKMDSEAIMWGGWCLGQEAEVLTLGPKPFIEPLQEWFRRRRAGHGLNVARQAVCGAPGCSSVRTMKGGQSPRPASGAWLSEG